MEQILLDNGIKTYTVTGGGQLQFNPADPNLFARFMDAQQQLQTLEEHLQQQAAEVKSGQQMLSVLTQTDRQIKELLNGVFGGQNDFDKALGGVNLLAIAGNGRRVVSNLFDALEQIITQGAEDFARQRAAQLQQSL